MSPPREYPTTIEKSWIFTSNYTDAVQPSPSQSIFVSFESSDSFILLPGLNAVVMSQVSREGTGEEA